MRGLSTKRNRNGFFVAQVHYSADPAKDPATKEGHLWYREAKKGLAEASWNKEYEIDWFALSGTLIYPHFDRSFHIVEPFTVPADWTRYMAIDPGLRNPTAALWAAADKDDNIYFYEEHYVSGKTVDWHAARFLENEKARGEEIFLRLIDPAAASRSFITRESIIDAYRRCGIYPNPANNDVEAGINLVNQWMQIDEKNGQSKIFFFAGLTNTIREITNYRWEEISLQNAGNSDPKESPRKKDDHLMDCMRYIIMARPHYVKKIDREEIEYKPKFSWDGMSTGY